VLEIVRINENTPEHTFFWLNIERISHIFCENSHLNYWVWLPISIFLCNYCVLLTHSGKNLYALDGLTALLCPWIKDSGV